MEGEKNRYCRHATHQIRVGEEQEIFDSPRRYGAKETSILNGYRFIGVRISCQTLDLKNW